VKDLSECTDLPANVAMTITTPNGSMVLRDKSYYFTARLVDSYHEDAQCEAIRNFMEQHKIHDK